MDSKQSLPLRSTKTSLLSFFDESTTTDLNKIAISPKFWKKNGTPINAK